MKQPDMQLSQDAGQTHLKYKNPLIARVWEFYNSAYSFVKNLIQQGFQKSRAFALPPDELHHIFVPYQTASQGGTQKVILRSGKSYEVNIPTNSAEGGELCLKECGLQGNNVVLILHTLFDKNLNIEKSIDLLITTGDIKPESKRRCREIYYLIKDAKSIKDLAALDLLDFIVSSSEADPSVCQRYNISSQNSRSIKIERCLENALIKSQLDETEKQSIRGIYQCIRAGEGIVDLNVLNYLDTIIQNSSLPNELKEFYFRSSVTSRAITTDLFIVNLINSCSNIITSTIDTSELLDAYSKLRDAKEVSDQKLLISLDSLILNSDIPDDCKVIYKLMREPVTNDKGKNQKDDDIIAKVKKVYDSVKRASGVVPTATKVATTIGAKAGTGAAFGTFYGGAAINATLAWLGGGSVAAGGLGMLGGLTVATGGAALIGAAALVSVASVAQMDSEDKKNLGVAAGVGVATSAAAVGTAWAAISAFGVASTGTAIGTLSGAAASSAAMAALGGVGVMTGGAAVVAFGAGFAAWKLLGGNKNDPKRILKRLEAKLYSK